MRISLGLPSAVSPPDGTVVVEWARRAETAGFDSVAVIDRLLAPTYDPLTVLAAAAAVTERIELITAIVLAPLRPAAILAAQAATVDQMSRGRLTLGLGVGSRKDDYQAVGVPFNTRGQVMDAQLRALRRAWDVPGESTTGPAPYRASGPPLLFGGNSPAAFRRLGQHGRGWICARGGARAFAEGAARARQSWSDFDRPGRPRLLSVINYSIGPDSVDVREAFMRRYYGSKPFVQSMIDETPTSVEELADVLAEHVAADCDDIVLLPCSPDMSQIDALAQLP